MLCYGIVLLTNVVTNRGEKLDFDGSSTGTAYVFIDVEDIQQG